MMLKVEGITKRFGGLLAVNNASLSVKQGSIVALIGPNGAGKTTLFSIISGFSEPDSGDVVFNGRSLVGMPPHEICALGLTRTFQIVQPFAGLSVLENIAVGAHLHFRKRDDALAKAREVAEQLGMGHMLDSPAQNLTVAGRKRLELAKAVATSPSFLLLDEVMAGLIPSEVEEMVAIIRAIRNQGTTILLIEHIMQAVMSLSDEVYVLNQGAMIAHGAPQDLVRNETVIEAYLGRGAAQRLNTEHAHA